MDAIGSCQTQCGGGGRIRTRDTVSRIHTFQACAFNHSATPPRFRQKIGRTSLFASSARVEDGRGTAEQRESALYSAPRSDRNLVDRALPKLESPLACPKVQAPN